MQFEFREVIDASPERVFETLGNGFGDVSTWAGGVALSIRKRRRPMMPVMKVAGQLLGIGGSSERAVRHSLATAVKTTAMPVPPLDEGVQASAHPTAPHTGTGE